MGVEKGLTDSARDWADLFRWVIQILLVVLMAIISCIGTYLLNEMGTLSRAESALAQGLAVETQSRLDLAANVQQLRTDLTNEIQGLSDQLSTPGAPSVQATTRATAVSDRLAKQIDQLSRQMYGLQSQLDEIQARQNEDALHRIDGAH